MDDRTDTGTRPGGAADDESIGQKHWVVIVASSLGTAFEWYDFFLYLTLAPLIGALFFPPTNPTAGLLASLAAVGAGFVVRPFGAMIFGVLGDRIGRKHTFLATIILMGGATAAVGLLPTYAQAGLWAPGILLLLRLAQGLALGGEYGGAAIYVAEHAPVEKRGYFTGFIQMSVVAGFLLSLLVILVSRATIEEAAFKAWGWRIPFLFSIVLLAISVYIRLKLNESPVFRAMKEAGATARNPLLESFSTWENTRRVLTALFGVAAGLTVVWYTAQFGTLNFLQQNALIEDTQAKLLVGGGVLLAAPSFVFFGWLSDRVGRKPVLLAGYGLTLLLLIPLFHALASAANPQLAIAAGRAPVIVAGTDCRFDVFAKVQVTDCAQAIDFFTRRGIAYTKIEQTERLPVSVAIGSTEISGFDAEAFGQALDQAGYPRSSDPAQRSNLKIVLLIAAIMGLSGMTFGQVAATLTELFPARIRYTSMSVPYHIGTGYFGGLLPFISQYIVVRTGDPFAGLWYTIAVVAMAFTVTLLFLPETRGRDLHH